MTAEDAMNIQYNESGMPQNIKVVNTTSDNNSIQKLKKENELYKKKCEEFKQQVNNFADINMKLTEENRELKELVEAYKDLAYKAIGTIKQCGDTANIAEGETVFNKKNKRIIDRNNNNLKNKNMNRQINLQKDNVKKPNNMASKHGNNCNIISTNIDN